MANECDKRKCVEKKLKDVTNLFEDNKRKFKKRFEQLVKKVAKINSNKKSRGADRKKTFTDYSKQHQARVRKQLKDQCQSTLSFLGQYNYVPSRVALYNQDTGEVEHFVFIEDKELSPTGRDEVQMGESEVDDLNMWLYWKDKFNISNQAWHELSIKLDGPPSLNKLTRHMKELNCKWNLKPTPGKAEGVQISFRECIKITSGD